MDKLGRNKQMIKEKLEYYKDRDVRVVILDIPTTTMDLLQFGEGMAKSMREMINNILIEVLSTIAEECKKIKQRQAEGIAIEKANGVYKGRKAVTKDELSKEFSKLYK
ncbi:MAG: recombinase family protein [Clostridium baratii]|nr:recombinase family protein [Clostridium baratii]